MAVNSSTVRSPTIDTVSAAAAAAAAIDACPVAVGETSRGRSQSRGEASAAAPDALVQQGVEHLVPRTHGVLVALHGSQEVPMHISIYS